MSGFVWRTSPEQAFIPLFDSYAAWLHRAVVTVCEARAPEIEAWMKTNALWTDRTGLARKTLHTQVIPGLTEVVIKLSHGMEYGYWLEVANAGRYAIIAPALDYWVPIIMRDIQALLR